MSSNETHAACTRQIIGLDESGTGAIAGCFTVAAVMIDAGAVPHVRDSKKVGEGERLFLAKKIRRHARFIGLNVVSVEDINKHNLRNCWRRSVVSLATLAHDLFPDADVVMDGMEDEHVLRDAPFLRFVIKADATIYQSAAASIIAKSKRDILMREAQSLYPGYGLSKNMGYGTDGHVKAILSLGRCPVHRTLFVDSILKRRSKGFQPELPLWI